MSQTVITNAFEQWKAKQQTEGGDVVLDEFIFADVPNLNPDDPISRDEIIPVDYIVDRAAVSKTGMVNANAVVFSVVLGADVGDYNFNWIGLTNKNTGTLAMVVHAPTQAKIATAEGKQGNVLTRSFLMEFNGAATETAINTPAETWQIDFTARLGGMDERQRRENMDIYGTAAFFGDGYLVGIENGQYFVNPGAGYVYGLRSELAARQNITVGVKPLKVWLDVCFKGALTSTWNVESKITVAGDLSNYKEENTRTPHFVFALALIDTNGAITDLRPKGSLGEQQGENLFLKKSANLSDINDRVQARNNLGLGNSATLNIGTTAGTVAAGDDARIVNAVQRTGDTVTGEVSSTSQNNWRIVASGYGVFWRNDGNQHYLLATNKNDAYGPWNVLRPFSFNILNGDVSLGHNTGIAGNLSVGRNVDVTGNTWLRGALNIGDNDSGLWPNGDGSVQLVANGVQQGYWNTGEFRWGKAVAASQFYDASYYDTREGVVPRGAGGFADQLYSGAPFYSRNWEWEPSPGGAYVPIVKGVSTRKAKGWPTAVSLGYLLTGGTDKFAIGCIHIKGDGVDALWQFDPNSGQFTSPGTITAGGAQYQVNGDIYGSVWNNSTLSSWLNTQFNYRDNQINQRATIGWVNQNFVSRVQRGAPVTPPKTSEYGPDEAPGGCMLTRAWADPSTKYGVYNTYRPLQIMIGGYWRTIEG